MTFERYEGNGEFWNPVATEFLIKHMDAQFTFEKSGAQAWLDEFRVVTDGAMDIDATAEKIGIPVLRGMPIIDGRKVYAHGSTVGLGKNRGIVPVTIYLDDDRDSGHTLTFGHELGHVFLDTAAGLSASTSKGRVEDFCEQFGRQAAVPVEELIDTPEVTADTIFELMTRYKVEHSTVIHQLMLASKLPRKFIMDTSYPITPNPLYAQKVNRHTFCHDCATGKSHEIESRLNDVLILDCTTYEWSYSTEGIECGSDNHRLSDDEFAELNSHYGRWTEEDEVLMLAKKSKVSRRNNALFNTATRQGRLF